MANNQGGPWRKAYQSGVQSGLSKDDHCPHTCGSKDWEWWWHGYWDGVDKRLHDGVQATMVNAAD